MMAISPSTTAIAVTKPSLNRKTNEGHGICGQLPIWTTNNYEITFEVGV